MIRHSALTCLCFAILAQLSSGCWCYRPVLWRFGCHNNSIPVNAAPAPIISGGPVIGGPVMSGGPIMGGTPGCTSCGSAPILSGAPGLPVSQGPIPYDGFGPGMEHASVGLPPTKSTVMAGPYVPPGGFPQPVMSSPPIYNGPNTNPFTGAPAQLGAPTVSKELPLPNAMPSK